MSKNTLLKPQSDFGALPPWMVALQKTIQDTVTEADIREIVGNQVKRAKAGDKHAIDFVFKQLMGGDAFKGATFVQNNNYAEPKQLKPTTPREERVNLLRQRAEAHMPLHHNGDGEEPENLRD